MLSMNKEPSLGWISEFENKCIVALYMWVVRVNRTDYDSDGRSIHGIERASMCPLSDKLGGK